MSATIRVRATRWVVAAGILLPLTVAPASAQTDYTWSGGAGTNDWLAPGNWTPSGPPGVPGNTGNLDRALFDTVGTSVTATNLDNGFNLGAIATIGSSGGLLTVNFSGNQALRLNGGYTAGSFTNVVAAAQNGRDLVIGVTNMQFEFGTTGNPSTFYADAGRTLTIAAQQINNRGGDVNKEGAGTLIAGGTGTALGRDLGNAIININGGTFAAHQSLNNVTRINVASGASLQPGLTAGDSLSVSTTVEFLNDAGLQIVTNGTAVSQLQNASLIKGENDTFRITLTGIDPSGTQTFSPNGIIVQGTLMDFDPNGTYTPSSPGHFVVAGNGFTVTNWSLTVLNDNQIRLDSFTASPVPEPGAILLLGAVALAAGLVCRRATRARWVFA
jgi:hypothetical protein